MIYTPLKLQPCYKEYLWGGTRLKTEYNKADAPDVTAESWELADHRDGASVVAEGQYKGCTLSQLSEQNKTAFWGTDCKREVFPVMVKLIDAQKKLSIQVHPSDITAHAAFGEQGKAEMWYIVDCEPHAGIYYGFSRRITSDEFLRRAQDGSICEVLNWVPVSKGDVFYIMPGTIHAIGAGIVIAEIQQNSNTTFRVYDYQRKGADGKTRPLHLKRAAEVINFEPIIPEECKINSGAEFADFSMREMFSCHYFRAYRVDVHRRIELKCDGCSFQHILCVEGSGQILHEDKQYPILRGQSYFMPAALGEYQIIGDCRILLSRV